MRKFLTSASGLISLVGVLILIVWRLVLLGALPGPPPLAPGVPRSVLSVQIAITMIVLIAALYIVLSRRYLPDAEKWAFGTIGLLIGYWMPAVC